MYRKIRLGRVSAAFAGSGSRGDGAVDRSRDSAFHIDFHRRTEQTVSSDTIRDLDATDLDNQSNRVGDDREFTDVAEQTVVSRFTARGVMGNHGAVIPVVGEVEFAFRVVRDGRPQNDLVAHIVERAGDELDLDAVRQNEDVFNTISDVPLIILRHMVVDVRHADDVADHFDGGDTLQGNRRTATELLLEEGLLQDLAGSSREHADGFLLDIAGAVSVADDVQVFQVQFTDEDRRTNFVAGNVVDADVFLAINRVRADGADAIVDIFDGTDAEFESNLVLTETDDLGEVGGVLFGIDLSDRIVEHIVPADRDIEGERNTVSHDRDGGLTQVLFREAGIELITVEVDTGLREHGLREIREIRVVDIVANAEAHAGKAVCIAPFQGDGRLDVEIQDESFVRAEVAEDAGDSAVGHHRTVAEVRTELDIGVALRGVRTIDDTGQTVLADRNFDVEELGATITFGGAVLVGQLDTDELDHHAIGDQVSAVDVAVTELVLNRGELEQVGFHAELQRAVIIDVFELSIVGRVDFDQLQLVASERRIGIQVDETLRVFGVASEVINLEPFLGVGDVRLSRGASDHDSGNQANMELHDGDRDGDLHIRNRHVDVGTERFLTGDRRAVEHGGDIAAVQGRERTSFRSAVRGVIGSSVLQLPSGGSTTTSTTIHDVQDGFAALFGIVGRDTGAENEVTDGIDAGGVHRGFEGHVLIRSGDVLTGSAFDHVPLGEEIANQVKGLATLSRKIGSRSSIVRKRDIKLLQIFVQLFRHCHLSSGCKLRCFGNLMKVFNKFTKHSTVRRWNQCALMRLMASIFITDRKSGGFANKESM